MSSILAGSAKHAERRAFLLALSAERTHFSKQRRENGFAYHRRWYPALCVGIPLTPHCNLRLTTNSPHASRFPPGVPSTFERTCFLFAPSAERTHFSKQRRENGFAYHRRWYPALCVGIPLTPHCNLRLTTNSPHASRFSPGVPSTLKGVLFYLHSRQKRTQLRKRSEAESGSERCSVYKNKTYRRGRSYFNLALLFLHAFLSIFRHR